MVKTKTKFLCGKSFFRLVLGSFAGIFIFGGIFFLGTLDTVSSQGQSSSVKVDGVEDNVQYLQKMIIHSASGGQVVLEYDGETNALRIIGNINADKVRIANAKNSLDSAKKGMVILGGSGNRLNGENGIIIGGTGNRSNAKNSILIGGNTNTLDSEQFHDIALIGTVGASLGGGGGKSNVVIIGGQKNYVGGSTTMIVGSHNKGKSDSILIGSGIQAGEKEKVFVWSDGKKTFSPKYPQAFYINASSGVGINTEDPQVQLDIDGGLKLISLSGNVLNTGVCNRLQEGLMAYVQKDGKGAFCGCNGSVWVPLVNDPQLQGLCTDLQRHQCNTGNLPQNTQITGTGTFVKKWNSQGGGSWEDVHWTFATQRTGDCTYGCKSGYHPGKDNLEGWYQGGCSETCSLSDGGIGLANWASEGGTGNNNCGFYCKAGYRWNPTERTCRECSAGKWTSAKNQSGSCSACIPIANMSGWTSNGTASNNCGFECLAKHGYDGNSRKCTLCKAGEYSAGKQAKCTLCTRIGGMSGWTSNGTASNNCGFECLAKHGYDGNSRKCTRCKAGEYSAGKQATCKECEEIQHRYAWRSNGTHKDGCDFSCQAGYRKIGRECLPCGVGQYSSNGNTNNTCTSCANKPSNAHYTSSSDSSCPWECDSGYDEYNGSCVRWGVKSFEISASAHCHTCGKKSGCWSPIPSSAWEWGKIGGDGDDCLLGHNRYAYLYDSDDIEGWMIPGERCYILRRGGIDGDAYVKYDEGIIGEDGSCTIYRPNLTHWWEFTKTTEAEHRKFQPR